MFTKGEWKLDKLHSNRWLLHSGKDSNNRVIAEINTGISHYTSIHPEEGEANAHLIAAAPDLYEELCEADRVICELCKCLNPQHASMDDYKGCTSCGERTLRLNAIAKAEGK